MTVLGKSPAFQFYPEAFLSDENVQLMDYEERGIYITLLSHCWLEGSIPADPGKIVRLLKLGEVDLAPILKCFMESEDDPERLINSRLDRERTKQFEWRKKCSKGGKASARKRVRVVKQPNQGKRHILPSISISNSNSNSKKDLNIYSRSVEVFNAWNEAGMIVHKSMVKFQPHLKAILENNSVDECKEAIRLYQTVVNDPKYFFTYRWTLDQFLTRKNGFECFLPINKPLEKYLNNKQVETRGTRKRKSLQKMPEALEDDKDVFDMIPEARRLENA
tara:strand:+ start:2233 stop:3063 length:831 start_codon:yes stop_codon:yes gene_type:complete